MRNVNYSSPSTPAFPAPLLSCLTEEEFLRWTAKALSSSTFWGISYCTDIHFKTNTFSLLGVQAALPYTACKATSAVRGWCMYMYPAIKYFRCLEISTPNDINSMKAWISNVASFSGLWTSHCAAVNAVSSFIANVMSFACLFPHFCSLGARTQPLLRLSHSWQVWVKKTC